MAKAAVRKTISTTDATKQWAVSDRTLRNWVADGCPVTRLPDGKPSYDIGEVEAWLRTRAGKVVKAAAGRPANPVSMLAMVAAMPPPPSPPAPAGDGADMGADEELLSLRRRLRNAERRTHDRYQDALNNPEMSIGELTAYRRDWQDTVDRVQKLEKEITSILAERGEFVAATDAAAVITQATAVMVQALDRIGIICGDRIAAMVDGAGRPLTAGDYRDTIDREVQRSKAVMQEQISAMMTGHMAAEATGDGE